jgi:hypothetical protein
MRFAASKTADVGVAVVAAALGAGTALATVGWTVEPPGRDGYYYVAQVQALAAEDAFRFGTYNRLAILGLWGLAGVVGDPARGIKLGITLAAALVSLLVARTVARTNGSRVAALLGAAVLCTSSAFRYFLVEFTANLIALVPLAALLLRMTAEQGRRSLAHQAGWGLVAGALHRGAAVVGALLIFLGRVQPWNALSAARWAPHVAVATIALVPLVKLTVERGIGVAVPDLEWLPGLRAFGTPLSGLAWTTAACMVYMVASGYDKRAPTTICVAVAAASILLLNPWAGYSTGMILVVDRLALIGVVLISVAVPACVLDACAALPRGGTSAVHVGAATATLLALALVQGRGPVGGTPQFAAYRDRGARAACFAPASRTSLGEVVAEHGLQFAITALCGVPATAFPPEPLGHRDHVWLLRVPPGNSLSLPSIAATRDPEWFLVPEGACQRWIGESTAAQRQILRALNEHIELARWWRQRPVWP